tara:strand:- start:8229 stop:8558 length:330 start_codon:yes stop_codon:yes gene_type:complete
MATAIPNSEVFPTKNPKPKTPAKAKSKANLQAVPKPTVKQSVLRHNFEGDTIKVVGEEMPVRKGSRRAEIFELFKDNMPLNEFLVAARKIRGGAPDVQIALDKKYIELV